MPRIGVGLGLGLYQSRGIFASYASRVLADGGITEGGTCVDAIGDLRLNASLLVIPSGYKGGTAYAEIPTNGNGDLTWTRASDAWRTNADGLIQRVPWNLFQYGEDFTNSLWNKTKINATANTTTAPNGTLTADRISLDNTGTGSYSIQQQSSVLTSSLTFTFSLYVKYETRQFIQLVWGTAFSTNEYANFDLVNGTVSGGTYLSATIVASGNGFYRISITTTGTSTTPFCYIWGVDSGSAVRAASCNGVGSYSIWGAQLVEGSSAQTYFPTTDRLNVPRLSYMYGSCPALLLEPQRTNLALQSQDFDSATWNKDFSSVTANTTTSPDGNTNADTYTGNGSTSVKLLYQVISVTNTTTYTSSIYAKKNTNNYIQILTSSAAFGANFWANFDLNSGVVGSVGSSATAKIESVGNGWYRCSITGAAIATTTASNAIYSLITSATSTRSESNSLSTSVFVYGAQFELGAYPTTYIPTTSASATRVADSFSRSNIYTNGLITSSGGTWFVELRGNTALLRDGYSAIGIGDTTGLLTNSLVIYPVFVSSRKAIAKYVGGVFSNLYTTTSDTTKIAIKWNGTTADIFANGTKVISATAFTTTNMENLVANAQGTPSFIQAMALYPTPLSDTDCTTITTL